MVADKVVNHFLLVEKGFFVKRFAPEIKMNRICIQGFQFLNSTLAKLAFSAFFFVFFEARHSFHNEAKARQRSKHNGVQSYAPGNRGSYDGFACNNIAKQIFFFERRGTASHNRSVSCGSRHRDFSTFQSCLLKGRYRCG